MPALRPNAIRHRRQRGVSLVVVLLILIIVSLLGAGAAQMALMGERTTRADRDYQVAFQAAEAALSDALSEIEGPIDPSVTNSRLAIFTQGNKQGFIAGCNNGTATRGLCLPMPSSTSPTDKDVWYQVDFTDAGSTAKTVAYGTYTGRQMSYGGGGLQPAALPRYIIEVEDHTEPGMDASHPASKITMYRITAVGFGPTQNARVMLQAEYENLRGQ